MAYQIPDDVNALENLVVHLDTLYECGEECVDFEGNVVEDSEYDALVRKLKQLKPEIYKGSTSLSTFDPVGGNLVTHNPPMTSIAKADGTKEEKQSLYEKWLNTCCNRLSHKPDIVQSYKHDGVAVSIRYKNGKLIEAGLRPRNGIKGINVTENIQHVKGVPTTLPIPVSLTIRGELECLHDDFLAVQAALKSAGEDLRANPRNHTAGAINQQKDPSKTADGKISFVGYNVVAFDDASKYYTTHIGMAKWVNKTLNIPFVRTMPHRFEDLSKMEENAKNLPYEVDGVVLKVDNIEDYEQLGHHGDDPVAEPRGALAWKFEEERAQAVVDHLEWSTSRTGRVTPVAVFESSVPLAGTMVGRATCSNVGWVSRMQIGKGTRVSVYKAGKIIPKIESVVDGGVSQVEHPTQCPTCGQALVVESGKGNSINEDLICHNKNCAARHVEGIAHYLKTIEAKGLGVSKIEEMLKTGKIKTLADIYELNVQDLLDVGFSTRESLLAIATIHNVKPSKDDDTLAMNILDARGRKKVIPLWQFFAALGIPGAGKTVGKMLSDTIGDMNKIKDLAYEDLIQMDGVGESTAESIVAYFRDYRQVVDKLLTFVECEGPKKGLLTGKTFCLTGGFPEGKAWVEKLIMDQGGKSTSSVSKKVHFVVVGTDAGIKAQKADEYGIPKITLDDLKKMLCS